MYAAPILLVVLSAILHLAWNVKVQSSKDPLATTTIAVSLGALIYLPIVFFYWLQSGQPNLTMPALLFGILTGLAELGYFYFLSYSYRHGELSVVYPIARGSAPIMTFAFAVIFLHESVSSNQILGVASLILGIWLIRSTQLHGAKGAYPALITGLFIASYTVLDKLGLEHADPVVFGGLKYFFTAVCLLIFVAVYNASVSRQSKKIRLLDQNIKVALFVGISIIATYQLVLFAMTMAPVAIISPLRESASVFVTIWGIWSLKERRGVVSKLTGAICIIFGVALLAI